MHTRLMKVVIPAALVAASLFGCTPALRITTYAPAKYNLGRANQLSVVQMEGRRSAKEFVLSELQRQGRATNRFQVKDRSEEGITVKVAGRTVQVSGGTGQAQTAEEVGIRLDVLEWGASKESSTVKDSKGVEKTVTKYVGKVVLSATVFNAGGKAILAETEYIGRMESPDGEDKAAQLSAGAAVTQLLQEITPVPVSRSVTLDDSDEGQKAIIETAKNGNLGQAITDAKGYCEKNPTSGAAYYNLAVFLDASGSYEEALAAYDKAISLGNKPLYTSARGECAGRLAAAQALNE